MDEPKVTITRRGAERLARGHLWIYRADVEKAPPALEGGEVVLVTDGRGRFPAKAFWSARSKIALRIVTRDEEPVDEDFFAGASPRGRDRPAASGPSATRRSSASSTARRTSCPGSWWTATATSRCCRRSSRPPTGARRSSPSSSRRALGVRAVLERNDVRVRELEGLAQVKGVLRGADPGPVEYREGEVRMRVDLLAGQKTGAFLDQRENHLRAGEYARGRCARLLQLRRRLRAPARPARRAGHRGRDAAHGGGAAARERRAEPRRRTSRSWRRTPSTSCATAPRRSPPSTSSCSTRPRSRRTRTRCRPRGAATRR